jgi:hypothetical protein
MQCCGTPVRVGTSVTWTITDDPDRGWLAEVIGAQVAAAVTHREDHHGDLPEQWPSTTGRVTGVRSCFCRYTPEAQGSRSMRPVPGSTVFRDQEGGDGWEQDTEELRFVGYLVTLDIF